MIYRIGLIFLGRILNRNADIGIWIRDGIPLPDNFNTYGYCFVHYDPAPQQNDYPCHWTDISIHRCRNCPESFFHAISYRIKNCGVNFTLSIFSMQFRQSSTPIVSSV